MHPWFAALNKKAGALNKTGILNTVKALRKPLHITINSDAGHWQRSLTLPAYLLIVLLASLLVATVMIGHSLFPPARQTALQDQVAQLQQDQDRLHEKLAETEALLSISNGQVGGMKQDMAILSAENRTMQKRLDMFEDVLAARKVRGIHFLRPMATWQDSNTIAYQLILVKGENYPRWIKGHLLFTVTDAEGKTVSLNSKKGKKSLRVEMKTHAFMEGTLAWPQSWQPERLTVTLIDYLDRKKGTIEIPIFKASSQSTANLPQPDTRHPEPSL